MPNYKDKTRKL